ncbi:plasmid mobilization relaxosome protein MobC, partial [Enterobacter hormaechei]
MGNNLNQIARKVNAGGAGHDRVQIVTHTGKLAQ